MKTDRRNLWLVVLTGILVVNLGIGFCVFSRESEANGDREAFEKVGILMQVLHLIRQDYVHPEKVSYTELLYGAMRGMTSELDPFSEFMTAEEYRGMMEVTEGKFGGLGVTVVVRNGVLTVVAPIEGSPGAKAGIQPGDLIIKIGDKLTQELELSSAVNQLKGDPGSKITITIYRPATKKTQEMTIERAVIDLPSVTHAQMLDGQVGYVRITEFSEPTGAKLAEALRRLEQQKATALILDLRNNPGGLLESAVEVCSLFLPNGKLAVFTEGRRPSQKQEFTTLDRNRYKFPDVPVVILVNQGSASAAEIVAGCLQDWNRAVLVGEKTFGKGSVQNLIELADGSALRLTTAMYYTPSKRVIHEHGIEPTIKVALAEGPNPATEDPEEAAEMAMSRPDPAKDRQLRRALEAVKSYEIFLNAKSAVKQASPPAPATPKAPAPALVPVTGGDGKVPGPATPAPAPEAPAPAPK